MSTAIDDLRSMLDERHVKWRTDTSVTNKVEWTIWKSPWFKEVWAKEVDGSISIFNCSMTPEQAIEATLGRGTCKEVYLLMAMDIGDGREEVLGVYATEEAAMTAINENQFGYAFHHVRKWEVDE